MFAAYALTLVFWAPFLVTSAIDQCYECDPCSPGEENFENQTCEIAGGECKTVTNYGTGEVYQKQCVPSCSESITISGGILERVFCCDTHLCNDEVSPQSTNPGTGSVDQCYQCDPCLPGEENFENQTCDIGSAGCATVVSRNTGAMKKFCASFCNPGTNAFERIYCCNSHLCNDEVNGSKGIHSGFFTLVATVPGLLFMIYF